MKEANTGYYANVIEDSISLNAVRLTTLEICFPRFILAEFNTHRVFSRNSASSRAIPVKKQLERIKKYSFIPAKFPVNEPGMSSSAYYTTDDDEYWTAADVWFEARDAAVAAAEKLVELNVHKQTANRLLEPFMWHTCVVTSTDLENFFNLRISEFAQPEIYIIAELMKNAMDESVPTYLQESEWHLPYVTEEERREYFGFSLQLARISAGRCAAVTLLNQDSKNVIKDIERTDKMIANGHMSPLEHPAKISSSNLEEKDFGNFSAPWLQYRKMIPNEKVYVGD